MPKSGGDLVRPRDGRWIAGVCAGLAVHLGIDVRLVRVGAVVLALPGIGILAYLLLWVVVPAAPQQQA
ncbi:MAG: PspC domain-containing protein [Microthrixaceae bacterium]